MPVFSVQKKDDKVQLILNLKNFNEHVKSYLYKMDSIHTALSLTTQGCWMASLHLKDPHYSVSIDPMYQKFLNLHTKEPFLNILCIQMVYPRVREILQNF